MPPVLHDALMGAASTAETLLPTLKLPHAASAVLSHTLSDTLTCGVGSIQVWAMLVEMRIDTVSGFDLSALNTFRWHPHSERVDLSR